MIHLAALCGMRSEEGEKFSIEANGLKIDVENIKNHMVDYAIVRKIPRKKIEKEPEE